MSNSSNNNGKNNKGKLRRPLSAYNLYFRTEREVIRAEVNQGKAPADYSKHVDAALKRLKGKRGAAEFQAVASTIAARWKTLASDERTKYEKLAEAEMEEYKERKFEYHRTLVKECEMAARGKTPPEAATAAGAEASTEKPGAVPSSSSSMPTTLQGSLRSQLQLLNPQEPMAAAATMQLPRMPGGGLAGQAAFSASLGGLPASFGAQPREVVNPGAMLQQASFAGGYHPGAGSAGVVAEPALLEQMGMLKDYQGELFALRQQILRERLFLQARQDEKMRMERQAVAAHMAMQQQHQQQQEEQAYLMERQLALLRRNNGSNSPLTGAAAGNQAEELQAKRAALAAMVRASFQD